MSNAQWEAPRSDEPARALASLFHLRPYLDGASGVVEADPAEIRLTALGEVVVVFVVQLAWAGLLPVKA